MVVRRRQPLCRAAPIGSSSIFATRRSAAEVTLRLRTWIQPIGKYYKILQNHVSVSIRESHHGALVHREPAFTLALTLGSKSVLFQRQRPASYCEPSLRDQIFETDGLLFKGRKLIIPKSLHGEMIELIHESHQGIERCKRKARRVLYWPEMTRDIETAVQSCAVYLRYRRSKPKEPMIPHTAPERAWQKLADVMTFCKKDYVLTVDYYSKCVELYHLQDKTAQSIIVGLKSFFARHGISGELVSDNMPFGSRLFANSRRGEDLKSPPEGRDTHNPTA